jgi:hypothetical protein
MNDYPRERLGLSAREVQSLARVAEATGQNTLSLPHAANTAHRCVVSGLRAML